MYLYYISDKSRIEGPLVVWRLATRDYPGGLEHIFAWRHLGSTKW